VVLFALLLGLLLCGQYAGCRPLAEPQLRSLF